MPRTDPEVPDGPGRSSTAAVTRIALSRNEERGLLAGTFYLMGGVIGLLVALSPATAAGPLAAASGMSIVVGLAALVTRRRFSYGATLVTSGLGPPFIALGVVLGSGGAASAALALLYAFVAVHTALVLHRRHVALVLAWSAVTAMVAAQMDLVEASARLLATVAAGHVLIYGTIAGVVSWLVQEIQRQATRDPLTGLANRSAFSAALEHARATVERTGEPLSVVALDLDGFKQINDAHGHAKGDAVLVAVSRAWMPELRQRDVLGRLGGDEFGVVLPGADLVTGRAVAERLVARMPPGVGCSAGVATWSPGQDLDELMIVADRALYAAKASRVEVLADRRA